MKIWNTSEPPNLGAEWVPGLYQIWPVEYAWDRGFYYEEAESRIYCLFTFEILEDFVKKYFNPLKPDSARVVYQIWPDLYADPKIEPSPKKMEVEIRDKDSVLVYGPRDLIQQEMKNQVLFWDGKNNGGEYTDPDSSPYLATIKLTYKETKGERQDWIVRRSTTTNNAPAIVGVPILTRLDVSEIPTSKIRYLNVPGDLRFSTVVLCKVNNTGDPLEDFQCYHPNPYLISPTVRIYDPEWPAPHEFEFEVKQWRLFIWGFLSHLRWCEVKPKIIDDTLDKVGYADSTVLGNWIYDNGFGWKWNENIKEMSEGTLRYRAHIENWEAGRKLQEATTPQGIGLYRVSVKGNYTNNIIQWASSYINVPYVLGVHPNVYGQNIVKSLYYGYEGIECSGLACWTYIWDGEPLEKLNPAYPDDTVDCVDNTDATTLHGWPGNTNLIVEDSDNDNEWDGYDDNDINKNQIFEDEEWEALHEKMNLAQDGDMWFVAHNIGKNNTLTNNIDHMGMYLEIETTPGVLVPRIIHASSGEDKVILDINPKENRFWNGEWERAIFRGLRRR